MVTSVHRQAGNRPAIVRPLVWLAIFLVVLLAILFLPLRQHLKAAFLLWRLEDPDTTNWLAKLGAEEVRVENATIPAATPIKARFYRPGADTNAPVMIVLHGVHRLGIDEPRLMAFAKALSSRGFLVITPELQDLADYRVTTASIATIGQCARFARQSFGKPAVIVGLSFAGGLALMAAARPEWRDDIAMVVAVGAHDSLQRVLEFYATNQIETPTGKVFHLQAHEYGPLIAVYDYPQEFFSPGDIPAARIALKHLLWEQVERARADARRLSPQGRQLMDLLFAHRIDVLAPVILRGIRKYKDEFAAVSPSGNLDGLRAPVYLLHGAGDNIIPASESEWLERDLPAGCLRKILISPVLSHLEMNGSPLLWDRLKLVHFMSDLLRDSQSAAPAKPEPPKASRLIFVSLIASRSSPSS
jgi:pimeloyl-ACP methyl ester carboxylesterase